MNNFSAIQRRFVIASVAGHFLLFAFLIYTHRKNSESKMIVISATVIQAVDAQAEGLPNILKKDLGKVLDKSSVKEDPSTMALPSLKELAVSKMKAIENLKKSIAKSNYLEKIKIIKGLRAGESLTKNLTGSKTGTGSVSSDSGQSINSAIGVQYIEGIKALVRKFWSVPPWMETGNLKASIVLTIKDDGSIESPEIYESSGNAEFDKLAVDAVTKAAPFQSPPATIREMLDKEGLLLIFP
ncbi:MAG: TonB family protein [Oligoflexia bacterium]|nr:TonB family protein [Oligoflexia bacterium]